MWMGILFILSLFEDLFRIALPFFRCSSSICALACAQIIGTTLGATTIRFRPGQKRLLNKASHWFQGAVQSRSPCTRNGPRAFSQSWEAKSSWRFFHVSIWDLLRPAKTSWNPEVDVFRLFGMFQLVRSGVEFGFMKMTNLIGCDKLYNQIMIVHGGLTVPNHSGSSYRAT